MFNRSRQVMCSECGMPNAWKGDPEPADKLYCGYCRVMITTHEAYLRSLVRQEVSRLMALYDKPDAAHELTLLKTILAEKAQSSGYKHHS